MNRRARVALAVMACFATRLLADHCPEEKVASGTPDDSLAGVSLAHDKVERVVKRLGPPTKHDDWSPAGMLGLLVATGLGLSAWPALVGGALLFVLGTWVRIAAEERLLRGIFGTAYEQYAREVPALVPVRRAARCRC